MRHIYEVFYKDGAPVELATFALIIFIAVFSLLVARAWSSRRQGEFDVASRLPLEADGALPHGDQHHV